MQATIPSRFQVVRTVLGAGVVRCGPRRVGRATGAQRRKPAAGCPQGEQSEAIPARRRGADGFCLAQRLNEAPRPALTALGDQAPYPGAPYALRQAPTAFTLIEVVIALTILAVLSAAAIPSLRGVQRERQARVPIQELVRIAKDARLHAMKEQRPYQVVMTSTGFTATRYFDPYLSFADLSEFITAADQAGEEDPAAETDPTSAGANVQADNVTGPVAFDSPGNLPPTAKAPPKKEWTERYDLPEGTTYNVKFWHETDATEIQGETVKLWVFQPSGICEPMKIHLARDQATFDIEFSALTVDIVHEASAIQ